MQTRPGFAPLLPLLAFTGLAAGTNALLATARLPLAPAPSVNIARPAPLRVGRQPTASVGPLRVTLTRLTNGISWLHPDRAPLGDETWACQATLEITEHGKPAAWEIEEIDVTDGAGRSWTSVGSFCEVHGAVVTHTFLLDPPGGGSREGQRPAPGKWKLAMELSRTSGYDQQEMWTVRGVPVPHAGAEARFHVVASSVRKGAKISLREIAPAHADLGEQILRRQNFPCATVVLAPERRGLNVSLVSATDDKRRSVKPRFLMSASGSDAVVAGYDDPSCRYHFGLVDLRPDAETVDLTFAVHESVFVEMEASPTVVH
jgi:hypothetical protein